VKMSDDELRRRLADLAESEDPWPDPLPMVWRQVSGTTRPRLGRLRLMPAFRRSIAIAAVAAVALIVGGTLLNQTPGSDLASKNPAASSVGTLPPEPRPPSRPTPAARRSAGSSVPSCAAAAREPASSWTPAIATVSVAAPAEVLYGMPLVAKVSVRAAAAISVTPRLLLLNRDGQVVGEIPVTPMRADARVGSAVTFGAMDRLTCAVSGTPAPPGHYQLVAIVTAAPDRRPVFLPFVATISSQPADIVVD
jgi:hypothetical protein